jgi:hypothetical protein
VYGVDFLESLPELLGQRFVDSSLRLVGS